MTSQYGAYALHAGWARLYAHALTHTDQYVIILIAFPQQQRASVLRYTCIACIVTCSKLLTKLRNLNSCKSGLPKVFPERLTLKLNWIYFIVRNYRVSLYTGGYLRFIVEPCSPWSKQDEQLLGRRCCFFIRRTVCQGAFWPPLSASPDVELPHSVTARELLLNVK